MSTERHAFGKTPSPVMKRAVEMVVSGESLRKTAKENRIAHQTLARYVKKYKECSSATMSPNYAVNRIFNDDEEKVLADYIKNCSSMFYGLTINDVRKLAYETAIVNSKRVPDYWTQHEMASIDWTKRFRKRNPSLSLRTPEACSLSRATSFNPHNVNIFYNNLQSILERSSSCFAAGNRIYNLDETGLTTVQTSGKILATKGAKQVNKVTSAERGTLVTLCCFISSSGQFLPPAMIFPRVHFKDHMLSGAPHGTLGLANPSGWMNSECFLKVIDHFVKFTISSKENPTLLLMDNHESHLSVATLNYAKENGVTILTFPPHSSNKMQPLDVAVYKPLKTAYNQAIDSFMMQNPGKTFSIYNIANAARYAFEKSMTPSNITSGFRKPGIYPFDRNAFSEIDFMSSYVTDRPSIIQDLEISPPNGNYTGNAIECPEIRDDPQPEVAINKGFQSPQQFKGYPKAAARLDKRRKRKKGRSIIATDTPEKTLLEERETQKTLKKRKEKKKTSQKLSSVTKRVLQSDSELEEDDEVVMNLEDSSKDGTFCDDLSIDDFNQEPTVGDYVLTRFIVEKHSAIFYVGQIITDKNNENYFEITFLRRKGNSNKFTRPEIEDIAAVSSDDIELTLPKPILCGHTSRQMASVAFQVDFSVYSTRLK